MKSIINDLDTLFLFFSSYITSRIFLPYLLFGYCITLDKRVNVIFPFREMR